MLFILVLLKLETNKKLVKKNQLLFFLMICFSTSLFSQEKEVLLYGKAIDSVTTVKNAHIINLNTNQGTFSNELGAFRIYAKKGDSLRVSSVQHEIAMVVITATIVQEKFLTVRLQKKTYRLDEIIIKKHNLTGSLSSDRLKTPTDKKAEALKRTMDLSKENMKAKVADDLIDKKVRPPMVRTDPNQSFAGAGAKIGFAFKYSEKLWALRRKVDFQQRFPQLLLDELGEKFFFTDLKIPKGRYHHFLEYCNPLGIEDLYRQQKKLEVIKILTQESATYLLLLQEQR